MNIGSLKKGGLKTSQNQMKIKKHLYECVEYSKSSSRKETYIVMS